MPVGLVHHPPGSEWPHVGRAAWSSSASRLVRIWDNMALVLGRPTGAGDSSSTARNGAGQEAKCILFSDSIGATLSTHDGFSGSNGGGRARCHPITRLDG